MSHHDKLRRHASRMYVYGVIIAGFNGGIALGNTARAITAETASWMTLAPIPLTAFCAGAVAIIALRWRAMSKALAEELKP